MSGIIIPSLQHSVNTARKAHCSESIGHHICKIPTSAGSIIHDRRSNMRSQGLDCSIENLYLRYGIIQKPGSKKRIFRFCWSPCHIQYRIISVIKFLTPGRQRFITYSVRQYILTEVVETDVLPPRLFTSDFKCPFYMIDKKSRIHSFYISLIGQLTQRERSICLFQRICNDLRIA